MNSHKALVLGSLLISLTACSSSPRIVEAQVPLVPQQLIPVGDKLPSKYRSQLENPSQHFLTHDEYHIELGEFYTSGLGKDCREIMMSLNKEKSLRVACAEPKQYAEQIRSWYLIPNIVQSASSIQL